MTLAIAILMKDPARAKTRLEPILGSDARAGLARLLFEHTLEFFCRFYAEKPLAVITPSPEIAAMACHHGAVALEQTDEGINEAAKCAVTWALAMKATGILIIHADIAVLHVTEMEALMDAADQAAVVIAQAHDGGSNALILSPPDVIAPHFGRHSAEAHARAAEKARVSHKQLHLPHLGHDIDTPPDLCAAVTRSDHAQIFALSGLPEIVAGDDLAELISAALDHNGDELKPYDIVVIAQKIISKSEAQMRTLESFIPSPQAVKLADEIGKDARKVEAILSQSSQILRARRQQPDGLLITRHHLGWICANAGIDQSNLGEGEDDRLLLLPEDPDASAVHLKNQLEARFGTPIGVIISDSFGRPWRQGQVNVALGVAGVPAVIDWRERTDSCGRVLKATLPAFADELAAASGLLSLKDQRLPVIIIRGLAWQMSQTASARDLLRPLAQELFL